MEKISSPSESAFYTRRPETVDDVPGEPEWHSLRRWQDPALLKGHPEVDVDQLGCAGVDQDVGHVAVAQAEDVANGGGGSGAVCVFERSA